MSAPTSVIVRIELDRATVETEIVGKSAVEVCERVNRSMRLCGVRGAASVRDGVVVIRELG